MIYCLKPYYNPNYTNPNKKALMIYALSPKNYTNYTNYIMQNTLIFKNIQINFIQNQKKRYLLPLYDFSNLKFLFLKRRYRMRLYYFTYV